MGAAGVCRCCLGEGFHKDMTTPYMFLEKKEIYSEMLAECFNVVLMASELFSNAICDSCVKALRESYNFKQLVLNSQEKLLKRLTHDNDINDVKIKSEVDQESDIESDDDLLMDTSNITKYKQAQIKEEKSFKQKSKEEFDREWNRVRVKKLVNRLANAINSYDIPKILKNQGNTFKDHEKTLKEREKKLKKQAKALKEDGNMPKTGKEAIADPTVDLEPVKWRLKWSTNGGYIKQKHKRTDNLRTLLKYTNALPFKNISLLGFICAYCKEQYQDPFHLRTHTEQKHEQARLNTQSESESTVKLDITDLTCTICDGKFNNLNEIKDHLVSIHDKSFHKDVKDNFLEFKLKVGDKYDCALCSATYETFQMLKKHMNIHYPNYQCPQCENAFVSKRSLQAHSYTHTEGSFECKQCGNVYNSKYKLHHHVKTAHGSRKVSNCPHCNEPFNNYYQRNQHLTNVHNVEARYKCNACAKTFFLKSLLMYHIKKSHLMERNFQCSECGFKFFTKKSLTNHMVKHTGERKYACEVCHKTYGRRYTLSEHMRIHNNDRRFKCDVCALTFVQKCSLKSHLLTNHGINLAASEITKS